MKKYYPFIIIFTLILVLAGGYFYKIKYPSASWRTKIKVTTPEMAPSSLVQPTTPPTEQNNSTTPPPELPYSHHLDNVPFQSQAPYAQWDQLHDEACEEATLAIAYYYKTNQELTPDKMEAEIQGQVAWEKVNFGGHFDLTAAQTQNLAQGYYHLDLALKIITSINDIKAEIAQDHLVIVPTAGRELGNPNFRTPGPVYHMVVVSGYNGTSFITQDVGTRRGQNYLYLYNVLFSAIHDWAGSADNITRGEKKMLVLQ